MQKIISLFQRNYESDRLVRDEVVPGSEWVLAGEGVATRKYDGCCCMVKEGVLYKRHDAKQGKTPTGFIPAQPNFDPITGHWPGWLKVGDGPEDKWFRAAFEERSPYVAPDGTYEAIGPHFQNNPEQSVRDRLVVHGCTALGNVPRTYDGLKAWFADQDIEGVVWHHPDGRMVKIKKKDFGLKRVAQKV